MDTNTLSPKVAATTLISTATHAGSRHLSAGPKRMAVVKVWNAMLRGTRNSLRATSACENTDLVHYDNLI